MVCGLQEDIYFYKSELKIQITVIVSNILIIIAIQHLVEGAANWLQNNFLVRFFIYESIIVQVNSIHVFFLKKACKLKVDLNSDESIFTIWHLFFLGEYRQSFFEFCDKKWEEFDQTREVFTWFLDLLQFYYSYSRFDINISTDSIRKFDEYIPKVCIEFNPLYREQRNANSFYFSAISLLERVEFFQEYLPIGEECNSKLKHLNFTLLNDKCLSDEMFVQHFGLEYTNSLEPVIKCTLRFLHHRVCGFRESAIGKNMLFKLNIWKNRVQNVNIFELNPAMLESPSIDFDRLCSLEKVSRQMDELWEKRSKRRREGNMYSQKLEARVQKKRRKRQIARTANHQINHVTWSTAQNYIAIWILRTIRTPDMNQEELCEELKGPGTMILNTLRSYIV